MKIIKQFAFYILIPIIILLSTDMAISQPYLISPVNNADCISKDSVLFQWEIDSGAADYQITVSYFASLSSPIINQQSTSGSNQILLTLPTSGKLYYWQIVSFISTTPQIIHKSTIHSFTTLCDPPNPISPTNTDDCVPKISLFKWQKISNATYTLQISRNTQFNTFVFNQNNINADSISVTLPNYSTTYYWRANSNYKACTTDYSVIDTFTTQPAPPSLISPVNNSISQSNDFIWFKWSLPVPPTTYVLQVATDSNFNISDIFYEGTKTINTDSIYNLNYNTIYYWRVKAYNNGCEIPWSGFYKFLTKYNKPTKLFPKTDTACVSSPVGLSWNGVSGAGAYRLQLSEQADFSSIILDSFNIIKTSAVYNIPKGNQKYYWRVKAQDYNNSGDWTNANTFTSAVRFPIRQIPKKNAQKQSVSTVFKWVKPEINSKERLQVAEDINFKVIINDIIDIKADSQLVKFPKTFQTYYWRILSNIGTCYSDFSDAWPISTTLLSPILTFPANKATGQSQNITFQWTAADLASTYEFNLATDNSFEPQYIVKGKQGITSTKIQVQNLDPSTTYYWRMNSTNSDGTSDWSPVFKFTTGTKVLDVPTLLSPLNGMDKLPVTKVTLSWDTVSLVKNYWLQINDKNDFITPLININDLKTTTYDYKGLNFNTTYYWRVKATNDNSQSDWPPVWHFISAIQMPTDAAILTKPDNNSNSILTGITFEWDTVARAENYEIDVSTDLQFPISKIVFIDTLVTYNSRYVNGFQNKTTYFWRVRGKNYSGYAPWSDTWNFTTVITSVDDYMVEKYQVSITPNPVCGISIIKLNLTTDSKVKIEIINLSGDIVYELVNDNLSSGYKSFFISSSGFESETYFCKFTINEFSFFKKIIIIK